MPATGYNVMFTWNDGFQGLNETYIWGSAADDARTVVYPAAVALMKVRSALMGAGVRPVRFRISKIGVFRYYIQSDPKDVSTIPVGAVIVTTNQPPDLIAEGVSNKQDGSSDQAPSCIIMDAYNTPQSHARKFLGGVPDVLVRTNPQGPWIVGVPGWQNLFDAYANLLRSATTQWSFKARTLPTAAPWQPVGVKSYVVDPQTSLFGVVVPTFANPPIDDTAQLQLRNFKMLSTVYESPNGIWQIDNIAAGPIGGTSTYYLRNSEGIAVNQIKYKGTAEGVDFTTYRYVQVQVGKEGTHKRGNRTLASPGRRRVAPKVSG